MSWVDVIGQTNLLAPASGIKWMIQPLRIASSHDLFTQSFLLVYEDFR
jgi:hypothetical protein